jgi:hypothetical protein
MTRHIVRKITAPLLITLVAFAAACGDRFEEVGADRLKPIAEGTSRDSVLAVMGTGPLTASFAADSARLLNGFRRDQYFHEGALYEVLYYRELTGNVAEPLDPVKETPIVLQAGKALGWGWSFYTEATPNLNLPKVTLPES